MEQTEGMPEMSDILLDFDNEGYVTEVCNGGTRYLKSTPTREYADEMRDVFLMIREGCKVNNHGHVSHNLFNKHMLNQILELLATIKAKEAEVNQ